MDLVDIELTIMKNWQSRRQGEETKPTHSIPFFIKHPHCYQLVLVGSDAQPYHDEIEKVVFHWVAAQLDNVSSGLGGLGIAWQPSDVPSEVMSGGVQHQVKNGGARC